VHPNPSPDAVAHALELPDNLLDSPTDTNRAVAQMHYTNRFARTANVNTSSLTPEARSRILPNGSRSSTRLGSSRVASSEAALLTCCAGCIGTRLLRQAILLRMLRDVAGINQVLYGTDFPYLRRDLAANSKQRILRSSELNDLERRAIFGGNASRLFPGRFHIRKM